jgi:hypothetical protein
MSHVQNVIMTFGLTSDKLETFIIEKANSLVPYAYGPGLKHLNPTHHYGGTKALEVNIAIAAFDYLDLEDWVKALREVEWQKFDCYFVQLLVQGQENNGFASIRIWDNGDWCPGDFTASHLFESSTSQ